MRVALSAKVRAGETLILGELVFPEPKTKAMVEMLTNLKINGEKTLIVPVVEDPNVVKSARNIPGVSTLLPERLSVYDILAHHRLVLTKDAVTKLEEALA